MFALRSLLDEHIRCLVHALMVPTRERLSRALDTIGWPAELIIQASTKVANQVDYSELGQSLAEAIVLQYVCGHSAVATPSTCSARSVLPAGDFEGNEL